LGVFLAEEEVDRFRVPEFDERPRTHGREPIPVRGGGLLSPTAVAPAASQTMTSQGTAHGRFQHAVSSHNLLDAEMAAREMAGCRSQTLSRCANYLRQPIRNGTNGPRCAGSNGSSVSTATSRGGCTCRIGANGATSRPEGCRCRRAEAARPALTRTQLDA